MSEKSLIERLREDYDSRRVEHDVLGLKIFTSPMSLLEQSAVNAKHPDDKDNPQANLDRMVETLVQKCTDAEGRPVFTADDKPVLKAKVSVAVLNRLMLAIVGESSEAQEKK